MLKEKKINLLVDGHFLSGIGQGTRTHIKGLYGALLKNYFEFYNLYVIGHDKNSVLSDIPIPPENFIQYKFNSNLSRLTFELPYQIRKHAIQYAHFQQVAPLIKNCKHITTVHDLLFLDLPDQFSTSFRLTRKHLFYRSIVNSTIKLTVSKYSKKQISKYYSIPETEISIIPNGISKSFFENFIKKSCKKSIFNKYHIGRFILFISRLEPRKNHLGLLKAFLALRLYNKGIHLVFIGKTVSMDTSLRKLIASLSGDAKPYYHHFEYINDKDLIDFYRAADLFVYPSIAEGFGIPPIEAAATGTPVLCSNLTAMSDFSTLGIEMFNPLNDESLIKKLKEFVNKDFKTDMNKTNKLKEAIKSKYSWENSASILHRLLQEDNTHS